MEYFKLVNIPDWEKQTKNILSFYEKVIDFTTCPFWNSLNLTVLEKIAPGLFISLANFGIVKEVALIVMTSNQTTLHTDHTVGLQKGVNARIQIPICNVEKSITCFYAREDVGDFYKENNAGTKVWSKNLISEKKPAAFVRLNSPTIIRTSTPHIVLCEPETVFPRITLTVSMVDDLDKYLKLIPVTVL